MSVELSSFVFLFFFVLFVFISCLSIFCLVKIIGFSVS